MSRQVQRQRPAAESDLAVRPRLHAEVEKIAPQEATQSEVGQGERSRPRGQADEPLVMFGQRVPASLQRQVKIAAVRRGIELQEAAVEAWRTWLATQADL